MAERHGDFLFGYSEDFAKTPPLAVRFNPFHNSLHFLRLDLTVSGAG
jgi:hypothetical protein